MHAPDPQALLGQPAEPPGPVAEPEVVITEITESELDDVGQDPPANETPSLGADQPAARD